MRSQAILTVAVAALPNYGLNNEKICFAECAHFVNNHCDIVFIWSRDDTRS